MQSKSKAWKGGNTMYFNVLGERVSRARFREMLKAAENRRELIAAGLTSRRDLLKMGLLTAGGMLVAKRGLSARAQTGSSSSSGGSNNLCAPSQQAASPPTRAFIEALPIMPTASSVSTLNPFPTEAPNTSAGESRTRNHQLFSRFITGATLYNVTQHAISAVQSPDLPTQTIWGFDDGVHATSPRPTYVNHH